MRVLVTGANGCIGAWITKQLLDRGADLMIYDLDPNPSRLRLLVDAKTLDRVAIEQGRIEDTERVKTLVKDAEITHIVHLAAVLMPFCQKHPVAGGLVNVVGTLNVFEAARDAGRPVRIVYASSSAVWGPEEAYGGRKLTEADPLHPATHYGVFKQANEENARVFYSTDGISSVGLRPWAVYGFGRDLGLTADPSLAIRAVAEQKPFHIRLSGPMDMQYVEDVAEVFIRCLFSPKEGAYAFNLAGSVVAMEDFGPLVDRIRPGAARLITCGGVRVQVSPHMDDSGLRQYLDNNVPNTPIEEGVRKTLDIFDRLIGEGRLT